MAAGADDLPLPDRFRRDGFARFPGFLGPSRIAALRGACDAALAGWQKAEGRGPRAPDVTNMAFLTDLRLWPGDRAEMLQIAEFVASPAVLALVERAAGGPVLLHNTQYFMEPHTELGRRLASRHAVLGAHRRHRMGPHPRLDRGAFPRRAGR